MQNKQQKTKQTKNHKKCLKQNKKKIPDIMKETLSKATCITSSFMFSLGLHKKDCQYFI